MQAAFHNLAQITVPGTTIMIHNIFTGGEVHNVFVNVFVTGGEVPSVFVTGGEVPSVFVTGGEVPSVFVT